MLKYYYFGYIRLDKVYYKINFNGFFLLANVLVATRTLKITYVAPTIFLVDSSASENI